MALALFLVCLLLMGIVLIQKGRGGGLTAAFGGGGGGGAFGAKTGDVFTGITVVLAFVYLLLTVFGNFVLRPDQQALAAQNAIQRPPGTTPVQPAQSGQPARSGQAGQKMQLPAGLKGKVDTTTAVPPVGASKPTEGGFAEPGEAQDQNKTAPPKEPSEEKKPAAGGSAAPSDSAATDNPSNDESGDEDSSPDDERAP